MVEKKQRESIEPVAIYIYYVLYTKESVTVEAEREIKCMMNEICTMRSKYASER